MFRLALVFSSMFLALNALGGCATLSKSQCKVGDWHSIGKTDGKYGRPLDYFEKHKSACKEHNIKAKTALYLKGRNEGLKSYCQIQHQVDLGLSGLQYTHVCKGAIVPLLIEANKFGIKISTVKSNLNSVEDQISEVRTQLRSKSISEKEQSRLESEENRLLDQQDRLRDELRRLKQEGERMLSEKAKAFYKQS